MRNFSNKYSLCLALFLTTVILFSISCVDPISELKKENYISEVFEYQYAPGQHAHLASLNDSESFKGDPTKHNQWVYLGGFGGYIIAGLEKSIDNKDGDDFEVFALKGASPEPAIVYVMQDENLDGKPNETWYELKGNQFDNSQRNYWLRYYKPKGENSNVKWLDSNADSGELSAGYGAESSSKWWWDEITADSITYSGTRLPDAYENTGTDENQLWIVPTTKFLWGYAENNNGTDYDTVLGVNKLDISNAVDADGNDVVLSSIRFIKVQTAVFQQAGWTNEVSSEVRGAREIK